MSRLFDFGSRKKKSYRVLAVALCFTLIVSLLPAVAFAADESTKATAWEGAVATDFLTGTGVESDPYQISDAAGLAYLAKSVNSGNDYKDVFFVLTNDIDLSESNWVPIGTEEAMFSGAFDGKNNLISGLSINSSENNVGLFGVTSQSAIISNIKLDIPNISGKKNVGAIVGTNSGKIMNCEVNGGEIAGESQVGGIVGVTRNVVRDCVAVGIDVEGSGSAIGGIIGSAEFSGNLYNYTIEMCGIESSAVNGVNSVGGVVGYKNRGPSAYGYFGLTIKESYNVKSRITGTEGVGGIVGKSQHYYTGDSIKVKECFNSGVVSGKNYVAGIVGWAAGNMNNGDTTIENCYNNGNIDASEQYAGGICGATSKVIKRCYNIGDVYAPESAAAICGATGVSSLGSTYWATIENCYYLDGADKNATQLSSEQFKLEESFEGWDFDTVWTLEGKKYPELQAVQVEDKDVPIDKENPLIQQVRKYVEDYDESKFADISVTSDNKEEMLNQIYEVYNQTRGTAAYSLLLNNNIFAAHMYKDFINDETDASGKAARMLLGMNGLIYGEGWETLTSEDPSVRKYRELLDNFIESISEIDIISYLDNTAEVLKDISELNKNITDSKIDKIKKELESAETIPEAKTLLVEDLEGLYSISTESETFKYIFSDMENILEFSGVAIDTLFEMQMLELKLEKYEEYYDFLDSIVYGGILIPDQLKKAAIDLRQDLKSQQQRILKQCSNSLAEIAAENIGELVFDITKFGNTAFGEILSSVSAGITLTDIALGMSDFVNASTYVEGYGFLQDLYVKKLEEDRIAFCEEETLTNAQAFYRDYKLLWNLRDQGENAFLEFIGYDSSWSGTVRQIMTFWVDYELLKETTVNSKKALASCVFAEDYKEEFLKLLATNKTITIACPVDVKVYEEDVLIGEIVDETPKKIKEDCILSLCVSGDKKIIRMPVNADYKISITARDSGSMDYSVSTYDEDNTFTQIKDIALESGKTYYALKSKQDHKVLCEDGKSNIELKGETISVSSLEDASRSISVQYDIESCQVYGEGDYDLGEYAFLQAVVNSGYSFVGWFSGNEKISDDPVLAVLVDEDRSYKAVTRKTGGNSGFGTIEYRQINVAYIDGGTISPAGSSQIKYGASQTFTIIPDEGYEVEDVLVDGKSVGAVTSYTFENVTANHTISATFKKKETGSPADADNNQTAAAAKIKAGVEKTTIKLKSAFSKKNNIQLNWTKSAGYKMDYYQVYRSTKRYSGYGSKAYYQTSTGAKSFYINTKELKKGTRYFYKVRGVRLINGEKVYTQWSNKAWRISRVNR